MNSATGCWECSGWQVKGGYMLIFWEGRKQLAHRVVFTLLAHPIPDDLTLDHVKARGCESTACCWPAHLEPVTQAENNARKEPITSCPEGHEYTPENTIIDSSGRRRCKKCVRKGANDWRRKRYRDDPEYAERTRAYNAARRARRKIAGQDYHLHLGAASPEPARVIPGKVLP